MGIYIKGMEMPKKGEYRMTLYVCDDGYAYMDVDLFPVDKDRFEAVPVPPHGKLIDADEMLQFLVETFGEEVKAGFAWKTISEHCITIIEAEGGT